MVLTSGLITLRVYTGSVTKYGNFVTTTTHTCPYAPIQMYAILIWEVTGRYVVGLASVLRYED